MLWKAVLVTALVFPTIHGIDGGATTVPPPTKPPTTDGPKSSTCSMDVMIVVDLSSSMPMSVFYQLKRFIVEFIGGFIQESVDAEIGIITYGCVPTTYLPLNTYALTEPALLDTVNRLTYTPGADRSRSGLAIRHMLATSHFRDGFPRAAVIMTDGQANDDFVEQAAAARTAGIKLYGVLAGNPLLLNRETLVTITGSADRVSGGPKFKAGSELSGKVNFDLCAP